MNESKTRKNIQNIEEIYAEFLCEMKKLEKEHAEVIGDFKAELEKAKIKDIRNNIDKRQ